MRLNNKILIGSYSSCWMTMKQQHYTLQFEKENLQYLGPNRIILNQKPPLTCFWLAHKKVNLGIILFNSYGKWLVMVTIWATAGPQITIKLAKQWFPIYFLIKLWYYFSASVHWAEALFNDPFLSISLTVTNCMLQEWWIHKCRGVFKRQRMELWWGEMLITNHLGRKTFS